MAFPNHPPIKKRAKLQFSLRTALYCLVLATAMLGWIGSRLASLRQQRVAVSEIRKMGGATNGATPAESSAYAQSLPRLGLSDLNDRIVFVAFHGADSRRWTIKELQEFGEDATSQQLSGWSPWTEENVLQLGTHLRNLPHLRGLSFCRTTIPPNGLKSIASLTKLENLDLSATQISGADLQHLANLRNLALLGLQKNPIGDEGIAYLRGCSKLSHLDLRSTEIGNESLVHIGTLSSLTYLNLERTKVSNDGLEQLNKLTNLKELDLGYTSTSDASVEVLASFTLLEKLTLGWAFTREGMHSLQAALPDCKIIYHGALGDRLSAGPGRR